MSREAFENALKEDRYDSTTRLVYADWLEERGLDDEAQEQRRMASPAWIEADREMHNFARSLGKDCTNYGNLFTRASDGRYVPNEPERWQEITYDMVMQAAQQSLDSKDDERFVQQGAETARDAMSSPEVRERFWKNWSIITGKSLPDEAREYRVFCCTC